MKHLILSLIAAIALSSNLNAQQTTDKHKSLTLTLSAGSSKDTINKTSGQAFYACKMCIKG